MKPEERFGFQENMPEEIRELFVELADEVVSLHHRWEFFIELFGKPENALLLAKLALASFHVIGESLADVMIMSVCRLSDKLQTTRQANLTLQRLTDACSEIPGLEQLCKEFYNACSPFRDHRNKRIGHDDLNTATKPHENPLPGISQLQVEEVLRLASEILKAVHGRYSHAEIAIVPPIHMGGAKELIFWIRKGYEEERKRLGLS